MKENGLAFKPFFYGMIFQLSGGKDVCKFFITNTFKLKKYY